MDGIFCLTEKMTQSALEPYERFLPKGRAEKAARLKKEDDYCQSVVSFLLAQYMLSRELDCPFDRLRFKTGTYGKPFVCGEKIDFSISHTKGAVACKTDMLCAGVDIENTHRRVTQDIWNRFFSSEESEYIENCSDKNSAFFEIWTLKEALFKAAGTGIDRPLKDLCVLPAKKGYTVSGKVFFSEEINMVSSFKREFAIAAVGTDTFEIKEINIETLLNFYKL